MNDTTQISQEIQRVSFFVPGDPIAKGRPRTRIIGHYAKIYTPKETVKWEDHVRMIATEAYLKNGGKTWTDCPVRMDLTFYFRRPKSHTKKQAACPYCFCKPDRDNLEKSVSDALEGLFFKNDSQICAGEVVKYYMDGKYIVAKDQPGVLVELTKIEGVKI